MARPYGKNTEKVGPQRPPNREVSMPLSDFRLSKDQGHLDHVTPRRCSGTPTRSAASSRPSNAAGKVQPYVEAGNVRDLNNKLVTIGSSDLAGISVT